MAELATDMVVQLCLKCRCPGDHRAKDQEGGIIGKLYNSNKNTSLVIARIFGVKTLPKSWTGYAPTGVFK
jgi:hypothetical protein